LAGIAREEGWVGEVLPANGKLFIHAEGEWVTEITRRMAARVITLGLTPGNDWRARDLVPDKQGVSFTVEGPSAAFQGEYRVNLFGRHQAVNALMAIALGAELGLSRSQVEKGLVQSQPGDMRLQLWEVNGVRVLDDAYMPTPIPCSQPCGRRICRARPPPRRAQGHGRTRRARRGGSRSVGRSAAELELGNCRGW
jgi:UDP-N-acetylmuramoyl-tripeptide--D-alanyl-D-alanine ligase